MKITYKTFTVSYQFTNSFWSSQQMKVEAMNAEQAKQKVLDAISGAYGSQILKEVTILN